MGILKISCYSDEQQMEAILNRIVEHVNISDYLSLSDIDEEMKGVRVCVNFESFMNILRLKEAEVLDNDWDILYEDTAVLNSRLRPILQAYNANRKKAMEQEKQIRNDKWQEMGF